MIDGACRTYTVDDKCIKLVRKPQWKRELCRDQNICERIVLKLIFFIYIYI